MDPVVEVLAAIAGGDPVEVAPVAGRAATMMAAAGVAARADPAVGRADQDLAGAALAGAAKEVQAAGDPVAATARNSRN